MSGPNPRTFEELVAAQGSMEDGAERRSGSLTLQSILSTLRCRSTRIVTAPASGAWNISTMTADATSRSSLVLKPRSERVRISKRSRASH